MKIKHKIWLFAMLLVLLACHTAIAADIPKAVERAAESVVSIKIQTSFGEENVNAVAIGRGSSAKYALTNIEALEGYTGDIIAVCNDNSIKAKIIATDSKRGLAILEFDEKLNGARPIKLVNKRTDDGEDVYAINYSMRDSAELIKSGTVVSLNSLSQGSLKTQIYCVSTQISSADNGGLIVNKHGNLVGMSFYDGNTENNKALTEEVIAEALDENDVKYKKTTVLPLILWTLFILAAVAAVVIMVIKYLNDKREKAPVLIGVNGDFASHRIPVTEENISIGRDAKFCQVVILSDEKVSRCHCSVRYDNIKEMFVITDLSSTHGTYINGSVKLEPNVPKYIKSGTGFHVGSEKISFVVSKGGDM